MVWPVLLAGLALAGAGTAMRMRGERQGRKAQQAVNNREREIQDGIDARYKAYFDNLTKEMGTDNRIAENQQMAQREAAPLQDVAQAVTQARGDTTSVGSEAAQGEVTRSMEGVNARAVRSADLMARIKAQREQQLTDNERMQQFAVNRNNLVQKSQGRQRIYPLLMQAAASRGGRLRTYGNITTQLGMLLAMYGVGGAGAGAAGAGGSNLAGTAAIGAGAAVSPPPDDGTRPDNQY